MLEKKSIFITPSS